MTGLTSQVPAAPYGYRPSSMPPPMLVQEAEVPAGDERNSGVESQERSSGVQFLGDLPRAPTAPAVPRELRTGALRTRAPRTRAPRTRERRTRERRTRELRAREVRRRSVQEPVHELSFTFILTGRSSVRFRVRSDVFRSIAMVIAVAPLATLLCGFGLRGAYEFPEVRAMARDVASALPSGSQAAFTVEPSLQRTLWNQRADLRAKELELGTPAVASELLAARPRASWVRAADQLSAPGDTIEWPVPDGWFVRGYGSGEGGYHRAVDVAAPVGSEVVAVAPGIVGYAGNQIRGYGNIVLLIHPGGLVTLYAHNSKNLVAAGQAVHRGDLIAEVGSTGISRGPHVHFEMLYQGQNCDPLGLFRPFARHRDGDPSEVPQATWRIGSERPSAVRCGSRKRHPSYNDGAHAGEHGHGHGHGYGHGEFVPASE